MGIVWFSQAFTRSQSNLQNITAVQAVSLIKENQNNPDFVIMDMRTPAEYEQGYIENATLLDFFSPTFKEDLERLDKSKTYLIYCRSGHRSGKTLAIMQTKGFQRVYNLAGGILEWQAKGLALKFKGVSILN